MMVQFVYRVEINIIRNLSTFKKAIQADVKHSWWLFRAPNRRGTEDNSKIFFLISLRKQ